MQEKFKSICFKVPFFFLSPSLLQKSDRHRKNFFLHLFARADSLCRSLSRKGCQVSWFFWTELGQATEFLPESKSMPLQSLEHLDPGFGGSCPPVAPQLTPD